MWDVPKVQASQQSCHRHRTSSRSTKEAQRTSTPLLPILPSSTRGCRRPKLTVTLEARRGCSVPASLSLYFSRAKGVVLPVVPWLARGCPTAPTFATLDELWPQRLAVPVTSSLYNPPSQPLRRPLLLSYCSALVALPVVVPAARPDECNTESCRLGLWHDKRGEAIASQSCVPTYTCRHCRADTSTRSSQTRPPAIDGTRREELPAAVGGSSCSFAGV